MRIVVFCPSAVGDATMATPTFRAVRHGFPEASIACVVKPNTAAVLEGGAWFDETILFHPSAKDKNLRSAAVIRLLRAKRFDIALLLPNTFRTAAIALLGGVKRRIGYNRYSRGFMLTDRLAPPRDSKGKLAPTPIVPYYLEIARRLGVPAVSTRLELYTTADDESAADSAFDSLGIDRDRRLVSINTGGAFGPAKNWPIEHFAKLARRIGDETDATVLVVCGPGERDNARAIVALARHHRVVTLADRPLGIGLSKACVKRSSLLITTDSGPRHFATAFGVPVLTLFGPTHIAWTRTYHPHAMHIYHPVDCGPCQRPECPLGHHRCMRDLDPDRVFQTAIRMLSLKPNRSIDTDNGSMIINNT